MYIRSASSYAYPSVWNGTQELRRGVQAEGYRCCGGRKQVGRCSPVQDRRKASKRVMFGSQYQLLADLGCCNCRVNVLAADNAGERARR